MAQPGRSAAVRVGLRVLFWSLVLFLMFRWFEHSQVYQPSRTLEARGSDLGRPWEEVNFHAQDGTRLHGWYFPADRSARWSDKVILLCHGNAGNISHRLPTCQALLDLGVSVFVFDYRGYGCSAGRPSEEGTYQDAMAAWQWLRQRGFPEQRIVLFGESLGGAIATELASHVPCPGLILMSTFTSIPDIGAELFPWLPAHWLCVLRYETAQKLPRLNTRLLVMHSRADRVIGYHHGTRLFAAAHEPKTFLEIAGDHNDTLMVDAHRVKEGIRCFLESLEPPRQMGNQLKEGE